ncbi:MAG: hypothetical protein WA952_17855 [Lewinella sp.]
MLLHLPRPSQSFIIVFLILAISSLSAQHDFRPGFIVTVANDTVAGEVDYRGDVTLNTLASFRTGEGKTAEYAPGTINAYGFDDGRLFVSETVDNQPLFLERLTSGRVDLYYFRDERFNHYLIDKPGLGLSMLEYKETIKRVRGKRVLNRSRSHVLLLNYYLQDWVDAPEKTKDLGEPRHEDLINLLRQYHAAVGAADDFEVLKEQPPLIVVSPELVGGYTKYFDVSDLSVTSYTPVGIIGHLWMPRFNERLYFRTGMLYTRFELESGSRGYYKLPVQLEYIYPSGAFRPRFAFGPNFNNLTANTVSGNIGAMVRVANRVFVTAAYELEFEQEFVIIPVDFLAQSVSVGVSLMLTDR